MHFHFDKIAPSLPFLLEGTMVTLQYTFFALFFGALLGILSAVMKLSTIGVLRAISTVYTSIFRGTPLLVQLSLIYFATPQLLGYNISPFQAGLIAFSLNSGAYVSEIIRAGIQAIDRGQFEAAAALGVPKFLVMRDIILPQAIKNILPALVNEAVNLLKESAIVSTIGELDLMRRASIVAAEKYLFFEPMIIIAVVYYVLVSTLSYFAQYLEQWFRRSD